MRLRSILAATTISGLALVAAPVASADSVSVKIENEAAGSARYSGRVETKRDDCVKKRTVQIFDVAQGFVIGQTKTDDKGRYELREFVPLPGQQVKVVVHEKKKKHGSCPGVEKTATVPG